MTSQAWTFLRPEYTLHPSPPPPSSNLVDAPTKSTKESDAGHRQHNKHSTSLDEQLSALCCNMRQVRDLSSYYNLTAQTSNINAIICNVRIVNASLLSPYQTTNQIRETRSDQSNLPLQPRGRPAVNDVKLLLKTSRGRLPKPILFQPPASEPQPFTTIHKTKTSINTYSQLTFGCTGNCSYVPEERENAISLQLSL